MSKPLLLRQALDVELPVVEVLDIGAMSEGEDRYAALVEQGLARVTGFEPSPDALARLNTRKGPYRYLPFVLGDGNEATFHMTRYPGCSSLLEPDPAVIDAFLTISATPPDGNFAVVATERVRTVRLDDVAGVPAPDLLKIDIQGAELLVLENAVDTLSSVLVLETEVEFVPLYRNQPLFGDMQCFLRSQGFMLHKLIDVSGRPWRPLHAGDPFRPLSQLLWSDAVFVRDPLRLAGFGDIELLKAALVLNDVYRSFDLVYRLLEEHDRRSAGALAGRYVEALAATPDAEPLFLNQRHHPAGLSPPSPSSDA